MARREEWINNKKRNFESSINDIVANALQPLLNRNSKLEANIILNWNKIFDAAMARKIRLGKVVFANRKENKFVLHVEVKNADHLEIMHSQEIIKEQLAIFLGYQGCERVVIKKI